MDAHLHQDESHHAILAQDGSTQQGVMTPSPSTSLATYQPASPPPHQKEAQTRPPSPKQAEEHGGVHPVDVQLVTRTSGAAQSSPLVMQWVQHVDVQ